MKPAALAVGAFLGIFSAAAALGATLEMTWVDARTLAVEGRGWAATAGFYDRLPLAAQGIVRQPVWDLSHDSAGMLVHFRSDAPRLGVRWTLTSASLALPNMSASGASGLDLYVRDRGLWRWLSAARPTSREGNASELFEGLASGAREFLLYLPLYNGIESLQLGIPAGFRIEGVASARKPVVFYGTSIVQGCGAMRPGTAYPALLGRRLDRPVINLGFSGNGKAEPEVASLLAELEPAAYVIDCLPNLSPDDVARLEPFLATLRGRHPSTPIVLVENIEHPDGWALTASKAGVDSANRNLRAIYDRLRRADRNLHYVLSKDLIGSDGEATVDGVHPTDLGMMRMADQMTPLLQRVLGVP